MITTRKFLVLGAAVTIGTLSACANEPTALTFPDRVFTSLEIGPASFELAPIAGLKTRRLVVRARDQDGVPMVAEMRSFSISSSDPSVATTADQQFLTSQINGVPDDPWIAAYVTAIAPGEAVISVSLTIGGIVKTAAAIVTVESIEGWSLKVDPAVLTVQLGSTVRVEATVLDQAGNARTRGAEYAAFTSDRDDVVALYWDEGCWSWVCEAHINILGVAPGIATITAEYGDLSATATVTVVP